MFTSSPVEFWERRRLGREEEKQLLARNPRSEHLAGPLPELEQLLRLPTTARIA